MKCRLRCDSSVKNTHTQARRHTCDSRSPVINPLHTRIHPVIKALRPTLSLCRATSTLAISRHTPTTSQHLPLPLAPWATGLLPATPRPHWRPRRWDHPPVRLESGPQGSPCFSLNGLFQPLFTIIKYSLLFQLSFKGYMALERLSIGYLLTRVKSHKVQFSDLLFRWFLFLIPLEQFCTKHSLQIPWKNCCISNYVVYYTYSA